MNIHVWRNNEMVRWPNLSSLQPDDISELAWLSLLQPSSTPENISERDFLKPSSTPEDISKLDYLLLQPSFTPVRGH